MTREPVIVNSVEALQTALGKLRKAEYMKRYRAENRAALRAKARIQNANYRAANRDVLLVKSRAKYLRNRAKILHQQKQFRENNPEQVRENWRKFRHRNKARIAERRRTLQYQINNRMRSRMHKVLCRGKAGRAWTSIVGYGFQELKTHIERQFLRGMSWENFGAWHIDHIVPLVSFNCADEQELRRAWAITNIRPMWADANLLKGAKVETLL